MKAGGLTAFCFHIIGKKKRLFGGENKLKELPPVYIPVAECKAWGAELERRVARLNADQVSAEDEAALDDADPGIDDPNADFIHYDPKDRGRGEVRYVSWLPEPPESSDE